ncbi:MAG: hypothetical protein ACI4AQ_08875 [Lachnospiraceae bacterium]
MGYTPGDIVKYIIENEMEANFMVSLANHVRGYSIGEIADKEFIECNGKYRFRSKAYEVDVEITDEDIIVALMNKLYVSALISRKENRFELHFLVSPYPESMKGRFEEEILKQVIQYMILKTVIALRLDTPQKVEEYVKRV